MSIIKVFLIKVEQPIGTFYCGKMYSNDLRSLYKPNNRDLNDGIQRRLKDERLKSIASFCDDPDATFPTPIIISINDNNHSKLERVNDDVYMYEIDNSTPCAEILDGQHRLFGILKTDKNMELPIVIMFNLTEEEKAYVFSTINSNQQKVDRSLIYDLFELSETRSPYKTCHELARLFNSTPTSPFYKRLKMLENRDSKYESLSQGTFVTYVSKLISDNPQQDYIDIKNKVHLKDYESCPLRYYFIRNKDEVIYLVLSNCFIAAKKVFDVEWNNPQDYILTKTTGFGGIVKFLKRVLPIILKTTCDLTEEFFIKVFEKFKILLKQSSLTLKSKDFISGEMSEKKIADLLYESFENVIRAITEAVE